MQPLRNFFSSWRAPVTPPAYCANHVWRDLVGSFPVDTIEIITELLGDAAVADNKWCRMVDEKMRNPRCWGDWRSWPADPATHFVKLVLALRGEAGPAQGLQKLRAVLQIYSSLDFCFNV
jgi:hypothetical protein